MFSYTIALQGRGHEGTVLRAITAGAAVAEFSHLRGAYAYASSGGAAELTSSLRSVMNGWDEIEKRWLISFDFGLTDPRALELLQTLPNSSVRVPYANEVLANPRLTPRTVFHRKTLILYRDDPARAPVTVALGSANMTFSGLKVGHEDVSVSSWTGGRLSTSARQQLEAASAELIWFDRVWRYATPLTAALVARYRAARASRPTPEDTTRRVRDIEQARLLPFDQVAALQASSRLWVQINNVAENLGAGKPGNQLHMRRGTRVFFGALPTKVPKMTLIATVELAYAGRPVDRHLRYSHNGMDTLDLPLPGIDGPAQYDHSYIMFTRASARTFHVHLGTPAEITNWRAEAAAAGTSYAMSGGREWGVLP